MAEQLDWNTLARELMQVLSTGESLRPDQPYASRDPGTQYRSGEVTSDVGLLDPVDLLAGMLASKGATLARKGIQSLRRPVAPQPVDIPFDRFPLPSSTIPKGPEIDLSPDPLPAMDPSERWLGDQLRAIAQRRVKPGPDQLRNLAEDEYDRSMIDFYLRMNRSGGYDGGQPQDMPLPLRFPRQPMNIPPADVLLRREQMDKPVDIIQLAMEQMQKARGSGDPSAIEYWTKVLTDYLKQRGDTTYNPFERGLE